MLREHHDMTQRVASVRHHLAVSRTSLTATRRKSGRDDHVMPPRSKSSARRRTPKPAKPVGLGALPEWDLTDLYAAMDAPEIKQDLDRGDGECLSFEQTYKGRLIELARGPHAGRELATA